VNFSFPIDKSMPKVQVAWYGAVGRLLNAITGTGTTAQRPTKGLYVGRPYFDQSLAAGAGKPIWYNGTAWVDGAGTIV
jgi:hypothetical protein